LCRRDHQRWHRPGITVEAAQKEGLKVAVFNGVESDPRVNIANRAADFIREHCADAVAGLAAAVIFRNPDPIEAYKEVNLVPNLGLPTVLIPPTAETG